MDYGLIINFVLLAFLLITAVAVVVMRDLFSVVMVTGVYSLISATVFLNLDAVDVSFTEAAVGAGISTVLMLGGLMLTSRREKIPKGRQPIVPLMAVLATGAALVYGTADMPAFGDANSAANTYVGMDYMNTTPKEIGVPNIVTAVLASYRGYDTLGETVVVFTAGFGVMILLGTGISASASGSRRKEEDEE
jgi:multicomponent Na+:H+ antiporter subunit B